MGRGRLSFCMGRGAGGKGCRLRWGSNETSFREGKQQSCLCWGDPLTKVAMAFVPTGQCFTRVPRFSTVTKYWQKQIRRGRNSSCTTVSSQHGREYDVGFLMCWWIEGQHNLQRSNHGSWVQMAGFPIFKAPQPPKKTWSATGDSLHMSLWDAFHNHIPLYPWGSLSKSLLSLKAANKTKSGERNSKMANSAVF